MVWEIVDNTLDEETETGDINGIRLKERMGTLGDHELVIAPKYCGKWLVDKKKWWRVSQAALLESDMQQPKRKFQKMDREVLYMH